MTILSDFLLSTWRPDSVLYETWTAKVVVSCERCKGTGFTSREELTDYHRREYGTFVDPCKVCEGDGRLTEKTEHLRIDTNYPVEMMSTKRVTRVPYSKDPIEMTWYSDHERGHLYVKGEENEETEKDNDS